MSEVARVADVATNQGRAWSVLAVVWLAGACAPANMAKVTTLAPVMMEAFGITESGIGWVIALFYVLGVLVAFPAAGICQRVGLKATIIASLAFGIAGGLLGVLSAELPLFMASRVLEGLGMGVMGVAGVAAVSPWFPNSKKGLPLSLWALWVSVPTIVNPVIYSWLMEATGTWKTSWWLMIGVSCAALVLFCMFYRTPNFAYDGEEHPVAVECMPDEQMPRGSITKALRLPAFWIVMAITLVDGIGFMAMNGFVTTYLTTVAGASLSHAAWLVSLGAIVGAVASPLAGAISDKIHSRKIVLLAGLAFALVFMWLVFSVTDLALYPVVEVLCGLYAGIVGALTWTTIGAAVPDEAIAGGTAGVAFFQNMGFFVGAAGFGILLETMGSWGNAMHLAIVPLYVIACVILLLGWRKLP